MTQLVIDRNLIRRSGLSCLVKQPDAEFILTDTFFVEMVKHPDKWGDTVRQDIAALAPFGNQIRISISVSEALRIEISGKRVITRQDLLPLDFQVLRDEMMQSVKPPSQSFSGLQERIRSVLPALRIEQSALHIPKARTEDLVRMLEKVLDGQIISDLRNGRLQGDAKLWLIQDAAFRAYEAHCIEQKAVMLSVPASMTSRFYILKMWRALWWLEHSGLGAAKEGMLHNDSYDDEYILIGSFLDGVLSNEKRVNEAYSALVQILECAPTSRLQTAFQKYMDDRVSKNLPR